MIHCSICSYAHPVNLSFGEFCTSAHFTDNRIDRLFYHCVLKFFLSTRFLRFYNTIDYIGPITNLSVSCRTFCKNFPCLHIHKNSRNCCCSNINGNSANYHFFLDSEYIINKHIIRSSADYTFYFKMVFS